MIDSKVLLYPFCFGMMTSPIFYFLINRIGGWAFISIFFGLFWFAFFVDGLIVGLKNNLQFSLLLTAALMFSYLISLVVGVSTVNYLLSIIVGNVLLALSMFALDYYYYGFKINSGIWYIVASCLSIIVMYIFSIYSDKNDHGIIYSFVYSAVIYCYLQAFAILHH